MTSEYLNKLEELNYADLSKPQEERLRELEKNFNEEFGTDVYFMVMQRDE